MKSEELHSQLTADMTEAMRDLLGSGYARSYYEEAAGEFRAIAEWYAEACAQNE